MYDKLTQSDIKKMEDEIEYRKLVVRKEAIQAVKEAREHGDLSENFEYHAAKKEKNRNESRIRYLERMIRTAQVISYSFFYKSYNYSFSRESFYFNPVYIKLLNTADPVPCEKIPGLRLKKPLYA